MRISVVIVTFDEGPDLEATVAQVVRSEPAPHEIIVVDDCSTVPVQQRLRSFPRVKVLRTPRRLGAGPAKRYGCERSSGDVLVMLDAHMNPPLTWLSHVSQAVQQFPRAIMCAVCAGFGGNVVGAGATWQAADKPDADLFLARKWLQRGDVNAIDPVPCLLGATYIIPRTIWKALDGINPNFTGWGYGEQDLSMRAHLLGYDVRVIHRLIVQHRFGRNNPPKRMATWHNQFNAMVTAATLFEEGVFQQVYAPFMREVYHADAIKRFDRRQREILEFRQRVQAARQLDDAQLQTVSGYSIPTIQQQEEVVKHARSSNAPAGGPWPPPCIHRRNLIEAVPCTSCGPDARVGVFQCSVHGRCVIPPVSVGEISCSNCPDRQPASAGSLSEVSK